jgi:disulfide bond formation protein DsbB
MRRRWRQLARIGACDHMAGMMVPRLRLALLAATLAAAAALAVAFASEWYGGLVPCALCLVERWPYRIAIALGVIGLLLPRRMARVALGVLALTMLVGAGIAGVHVGVEQKWWRSPLPECAAPVFAQGSIAERLASMPARPSKPCEDPTYLIPGLPVSMAAMDGIFALALAGAAGVFLVRTRGRDR